MKGHNECTGCFACQAVCTQNAIEILEDKDGFYYPSIKSDACIKCGQCSHICNKTDVFYSPKEILCVQYNNEQLLSNATSGGIIAALADAVIKSGGTTIGVQYDNVDNGALWTAIDDVDRIPSIQGSKYFQVPLTNNIYKLVEEKLKTGKVLFVGTPCQVASMVRVAGCDNLITVDLVCGGTASQLLEKRYLEFLVDSTGRKVKQHYFRKKVSGWSKDYYSKILFQNGEEKNYKGFDDLFNYAYNSGNCMRESCYNCQFTKNERVGDFTVGDAWGIKAEDVKEFDIHNGTSLVLINSSKAQNLIAELNGSVYIHLANEQLLKSNKPLFSRMPRRKVRDISYLLINKMPLKKAVRLVNYRYTLKKLVRRGM